MISQNSQKPERLKTVVTCSIAVILEWYNFSIFGFYAVIIAKLYFPFKDETTSIITTFIVFGLSFLFRPLGALVISNIGDKYGRKKAFILTVFLMTFPTVLIGVLPTYQQIGIAATILIIIFRIGQGLSLGGERSSTLSILVELSTPERRGFYVSFAGFSTTSGILLASAVCGVITNSFSEQELLNFGWRVPFLLGSITGLLAFYLQKNLKESEKFSELKKAGNISGKPITESIGNHSKNILITLFATLVFAVGFYINFVYLITFGATLGEMKLSSVLNMNTINLAICTALIPLAGYFSDKMGRKPLMIFGAVGIFITSLFLFKAFSGDNLVLKYSAQLLCGATIVIYGVSLYPFMVESFPTKVRMTALSIGHVVSFSIFGGSAPFVSSFLIDKTGYLESPGFYLALCSVISLIAILLAKETYRKALE